MGALDGLSTAHRAAEDALCKESYVKHSRVVNCLAFGPNKRAGQESGYLDLLKEMDNWHVGHL
jgi:hypothetical protein